ncbi:MAG: alanine dehydrogenase [Calditrichaeota bacterium]|nr:MAG: alanine dehydrogenase [Calditrichota bacterium]
MNVGIPRETAVEERRVALTPVGVYALTNEGHTVYVEKSAGEASGFSDEDFAEVGAQVVFSTEEIFHRADVIAKIQPPTEQECRFLDEGKTIFSFLSLGMSRKNMLKLLLEKNVIALGYELIERPDGSLPVLTAMSEIAGLLLPQIAGRLLECESGGRGIMLAGVSGIPPANVVILGAGTVGYYAARSFSELGAQVLVMDKDVNSLRRLNQRLPKKVSTSIVTPLLVKRAARFADVLIGAVMVHGERTPHLVPEWLVKEMKRGSAIIDVSIDQGGCVETSHPTTLSHPTYVKHGVIHYCVPNIPASVARTASHALNNALLPRLLLVAQSGVEGALKTNVSLQNGTYLYRGMSTKKTITELFGFDYKPLEAMLNL